MKGFRLMCPPCYRRNKAWVLYSRCPFCGAKGKPIPDVVGPGWEAALAEMLQITGTSMGSHPKSRSPPRAGAEAAETVQEANS